MRIRKAMLQDFEAIYKIGKSMPELKVSKDKDFMSPEDFKYFLQDTRSIFLVSETSEGIVGFALAVQEAPTYAAMVYSAVVPKYRKQGIHAALTKEREKILRARGVKEAYTLATNPEIVKLMKHLGYREGKKLVWMDKEL